MGDEGLGFRIQGVGIRIEGVETRLGGPRTTPEARAGVRHSA
jgi:hypothetical protein